MKTTMCVAVIAVLALAGTMAEAQDRSGSGDAQCTSSQLAQAKICRPRPGGEAPFPFEQANRTAELADSSPYELYGQVVFGPSLVQGIRSEQAFLKVDLEKQPWLANQQRLARPLYPLQGPRKHWAPYKGKRIKFKCYAEGFLLVRPDGGVAHELFLKAAPDEEKPIQVLGD
jgi:hypothetical protein